MHIHSALSACGDDIMSPQLILEQAVQKELNLISIVDHNTVHHSILACKLSEDMPIRVIPGVELTSREEVHLLAYFPDIEALLKIEKEIDNYLPKRKNNSQVFGYQLYYDLKGEIIGIDDTLRQVALNIGLDSLVDFIHRIEGIAVPAHIDKNRFSLLSQLGFLDREANYDAVEASKFKWRKEKFQLGDTWDEFPVIAGSDSHGVEDIGLFFMEDKQDEIKNFISLKDFLRRSKQQ
ncbi:MAG: histidinol-phosphatase [Candidatus Caldatribacteriota bacterium]|nr:histidinol-phosphatase [Candidatus Caldatribacteriota bacterium]